MKLNLGSVFVLGKLSSAFLAFSLDKHLKKFYRTLHANYARTQFGSFGLDSKVSAQNFIEFRRTNNLSKKLRDYVIRIFSKLYYLKCSVVMHRPHFTFPLSGKKLKKVRSLNIGLKSHDI